MTMVNSLLAVGLSLVLLFLYKTVNLWRYVRQAKATGLPYVITPVLETEIVGFLMTPILRYVYEDHLDRGQGWPRWCRFIIKDWSWEDKRIAHDEFGDVFLCVSPEGIICYAADAAMGWDIMNRRYDFTKPPDKYKLLEPYGPNVATAEGATYRFHVRITAPPLGDLSGVNELVWNETLHQTRLLSEAWAQDSSRELDMDVNALTLAVISLAAFGKRIEPTSGTRDDNIPKGYKLSFLQAINDTTRYMVAILVVPGWLLNLTPLRKAHVAHAQLDKYLRQMIREERKRLTENAAYQNSTARANLLTAVIRASMFGDDKNTDNLCKDVFTENEVMGNLFIYLLAGYETTANAIVYGLITLALHPDIQDKVINEIDAVYASAAAAGHSEVSYSKDFAKLEYTYGFMYETFRLYPGVTLITKMATRPQAIHVSSPGPSSSAATYMVPAGTRVYLSAPGMHFNPRYWPSPYTLDPYRWISSGSAGKPNPAIHGATNGKRVVAADKTRHMRGTLLTFSDGARVCLGRKFAQAEYIAFLVALLHDYRVVLSPDEDPKKVKSDLFLKSAGKVTLSPVRNVKLRLERRQT